MQHKLNLPLLFQARGGAGDGSGSAQKHNEKSPPALPLLRKLHVIAMHMQ